MSEKKYTYRLNWIISGILVWEVLFWVIYLVFMNVFGSSESKSTVDHIMYKQPGTFKLLLLLLPISGLYFYNVFRHNRMVNRANTRVMQSFLKPVSTFSSFIKYFLFRNAFIFLIIALAQPIYGKKRVSGTSESLELVVCLDVSNSMNVRDISDESSRLDISKRALVQLVNNLHGEKIGICLFANHAFVQLPLTSDYTAAKLFIQDIETNMISSQGTNIAEALAVSKDMFSEEQTTKGIILVTDGENHEESPDEVLAEIKESKIQLSILGIGTKSGGLVPKNPSRPELGYKTDAVGKTVMSKLDEGFIKSIASKGGGKASVSSSEFPNLSALLTQIKQMKRTKIDNFDFDVKKERYQIPLTASLVFWIVYLLWSRQYVGVLDRFIKND
ncbi:MAG: VWA domain-containing protein [Crocinitomicaceae bacterium]|nr:VWA domain-containing protein [Crocinitomicaceae bacterium]